MQAVALVSHGQRIAHATADDRPNVGTSEVGQLYLEIGWRNSGVVGLAQAGPRGQRKTWYVRREALSGDGSFSETRGIALTVAIPTAAHEWEHPTSLSSPLVLRSLDFPTPIAGYAGAGQHQEISLPTNAISAPATPRGRQAGVHMSAPTTTHAYAHPTYGPSKPFPSNKKWSKVIIVQY